jgi:signal transduction histidine kinase
VRYVAPDGHVVTARAPGWSPADQPLSDTAPVDGGGRVTLSLARSSVDQAISDALLSVALLAIGLLVVAGVLGYVVARWLSRPFQELAHAAQDVGRGRMEVDLPSYSIPEADQIARALERAGAQVQEMLTRHRSFLLDASHELRTPITALRLELEDLSFAGGLPPAAAEQLQRSMGELDRLSTSVDAMLAATRERRVGDVDLRDLARSTAQRWTANLRPLGRTVEVTGIEPAPVRLAPGAVEQVLDGLMENAVNNGGGAVTLDVEDAGDHVLVRVRDEGPAPDEPPASLDHTVAAATACGGHLSLDRTPTTSYTLRLPRA